MNKKVFLTNKYTISVFILLACLAVDILLHKGMSRVIIPSSFTDKRQPVHFRKCGTLPEFKSKHWVKALNDPSLIKNIEASTGGFEIDVYFDTASNKFFVYHDSTVYSRLRLEAILDSLHLFPESSIWLDYKNLDEHNSRASLTLLKQLRSKYNLHQKLIIESSSPQYLDGFCAENFYTSYYVPFFNPYSIHEDELISKIDTISSQLSQHPVSALSGYYFQYPVLKKFFPGLPILTWTDRSRISLVSGLFNNHLENDADIKIILYPVGE